MHSTKCLGVIQVTDPSSLCYVNRLESRDYPASLTERLIAGQFLGLSVRGLLLSLADCRISLNLVVRAAAFGDCGRSTRGTGMGQESPFQSLFHRSSLYFQRPKSQAFRIRLLHGNRLREIPWLINIGAFQYGNVIGQQLQRNRVDNWRDEPIGMRHRYHFHARLGLNI